jgi:hypothetical protein
MITKWAHSRVDFARYCAKPVIMPLLVRNRRGMERHRSQPGLRGEHLTVPSQAPPSRARFPTHVVGFRAKSMIMPSERAPAAAQQ